MEVHTVQTFSRRGLGYLWSKRTELDPGQESIINCIYNNKKKGSMEGTQSIKYKLSNEKAGKLGYGRLYGNKGSLETLEKECRGTICKEFYYDVDIVNCHPVLLVHYAKEKYGKDLIEVAKYVENREEYLLSTGLPRAEAKSEIIKVMYGGVASNTMLKPMRSEVFAFSKFLSTQDQHRELFEYSKTKDNIYGSFLSYILQTEERHCMLAMREYLESQKWSVDVLCYDGVMIRKRDDIVADDKLLREVEKFIETKTTYKVVLDYKEFQSYEVPQSDEELVPGVSKTKYLEMKNDFEVNHFYYIPTNQYAEVKNGLVSFYDLGHAKEVFGLKYYFKNSEKHGDSKYFFDIWRDDTSRKAVERIDFKATDEPNVFVLPLNFEYTKNTPTTTNDAIELFETLLSINTCNNLILRDYVRNYLAHILQQPLELPGVAIILTGKKGTGKDTLIDFFMKYVIGRQYSHNYENNEDFFEKHDLGRKDKFIVKLEEADRMLCMRNASSLKSKITSETETFNPKGHGKMTCSNYCRFIFTTNKPNPVEMTDGERRFVIIPTSPEKKGDFDFWATVRRVLFTPEAGASIAKYLMEHSIQGFNPRVLPFNEYQNEVVMSEKTSDEQFFESNTWDGEATKANALFNLYRGYCIMNELEYMSSLQKFGRCLVKYMKAGEVVLLQREINREGVTYKLRQ